MLAPPGPRMDRRQREARALHKAFVQGMAGDVRPAGPRNVYYVPSLSEPGLLHQVVANPSGRFWCSCPAGASGQPCSHAAAVWIHLLERRGASVLYVKPPA